MAKHEWRKKEKDIYLPKNSPEFIVIPEYQFITIAGEGHPESQHFSDCIGVLYALSYAIKMNAKKISNSLKGYIDYTVYPLEGLWDINAEARKTFDGTINKEDFLYKLMIRQPDFIEQSFFMEMLDLVKKKKPYELLTKVQFEKITDGKCIQLLHVGSYDDEPANFKKMEAYAKSKKLKRLSKAHREIYLSDFRKVPVDKLKTVLRFKVK
jgi:hypothetical protein